jgi:hypothetical protein
MLLPLTISFDFCAIGISLWLALYLLGRGYPSRITLRAVIVLLALSGFFLGAFFNIYHQVPGSASLRAALLVIVLATWYSLTIQLLPQRFQTEQRYVNAGLYAAAVIVIIILLSTRGAFVEEQGNNLWVAHMGISLPFILYGVFQILASVGILYNLLSDPKIGLSAQGKSFLVASLLPIGAVGYGVIALALPVSMPRLIQDVLIFSGVFLMGYCVARYQTLVERRTTLQDFPLSGLVVLGFSAGYALLVWRLGYDPEVVALVMVLVIITLSIYDLVREFLERQRYRHESAFRSQLRQLEHLEGTPDAMTKSLQEGLELLCQTIEAGGGWIAELQANGYVVTATHHSLAIGSRLSAEIITGEDVFQPDDPSLINTAWIAAAIASENLMALVGVNPPRNKLSYSVDDLDLLVEVADRVATILSLFKLRSDKREQIRQLVSDAQSEVRDLRSSTDALMTTLASNPDPAFISLVEDALRHLSDYVTLGQLPLADRVGVSGENHIERGRSLHEIIVQSIKALHPAGPHPHEPLPREWFNYVVLYDAYVECVTNHEIMARLYISEGTFNRTRRNALRGLARLLLEKKRGNG